MPNLDARVRQAIRMTAPGTALRSSLDMIIAGKLGALICIGDIERVLATGNDGFPLSIAFTSHRLFELAKMDGAIVVDEDLSTIHRANFHLNPDPTLPTSETGMRHRTAARMSMTTNAMVISISERRNVVNVYLAGKNIQLRSVPDLMNEANQLLTALQSEHASLYALLERITSLEFDNFVTLSDVTDAITGFQAIIQTAEYLQEIMDQLGVKGKALKLQYEQLTAGVEDLYTLTIRDYAKDSSFEEGERIREQLNEFSPREITSTDRIADVLGYPGLDEDSIMTPRGLRTLNHVSTITNSTASLIAEEFNGLPSLIEIIANDPTKLEEFGVSNPSLVLDSLYRMWGKRRYQW